jgi:tetratricopeptide (TPR) repeat protein
LEVSDNEAALEHFTRVIEALPDFAEGWNKRATVNYLLGRFDASVIDIQKTLTLEPRHFGALSGMALINLSLDREREALKAFEAAMRVHPNLPGAETHIRELREKIRGKGI